MATLTLSDSASSTFGELRQRLALSLRDGLIATATREGQANIFFDTRNLVNTFDSYEGSELVYLTANDPLMVGHETVVVSSNPDDGSITCNSNFPSLPYYNALDPKTSDTILLINVGNGGFRKQVYDFVIQEAVRQSWPAFLLDITADVDTAFDSDSPIISIPAQFRAVHSLYVQADTNVWREVGRARPGSSDAWGEGWTIDKSSKTIQIAGEWRDVMDGELYRIGGYTSHPVPVLDSDPIALDPDYIMTKCKAMCAERRAGTREWDNWAVEWGRMAMDLRGRILSPRRAGTVFLQ